MRAIQLLSFVLFILLTFTTQAQYKDPQERAVEYLEKKKAEFQNAPNDSLYIIKNSDAGFNYFIFHRGDQEEDIEEQIYSSKVGSVVGPFKGGDTSAYLFKVISFEKFANRSKAKLIYIRSNKDDKQDTASVRKLTEKYYDYIKKGKDVKIHAHKEEVRLVFKDLKWFYQDEDIQKEYYKEVMGIEKGGIKIIETKQGPAILQITNSKERAPYKVKLLAIVKRGA